MKCVLHYVLWCAVALCAGIMFALLFPIRLLAGIEAIIIMALGICFCFKK